METTALKTIFVGESQVLQYFTRLQSEIQQRKIFLLVDENTEKYCLPVLLRKAPFLNIAEVIKVVSGENNKNLETCQFVWNALTNHEADRDSIFINLGGGVLCDMGGFIAAVFKRGIQFINIPTTLLAMVDASFGGKTGIDFKGIKNHLGAFNSPWAVLICSDFLRTLDKRQILNGYSEIVKHALILDVNYWKKIKKINPATCTIWEEIINTSVQTKMSIIEKDPLEKNIRKKLNFGHTIGHAIESWSLEHDANPLLHGEAVAVGMICEACLSFKMNNLNEADFKEVTDYLCQIFPKYNFSPDMYNELVSFMYQDKKNTLGNINFSLLSAIGVCDINNNCTEQLVIDSLEFYQRRICC